MTAIDDPDVLVAAEVPAPYVTADHDVLVRLRAAGINPVDYKLRASGTIGGTLPAVLGSDGAGVVEDVGAAVTRLRLGDEVFPLRRRVRAHPGHLLVVRRGYDSAK